MSGSLGRGAVRLRQDEVHEDAARARRRHAARDRGHEFGELGIDPAFVRGSGTSVVELANGCICCVNRGPVAATLGELARRADRIDAIVVETSGVADPLGSPT